MILRTESDVRVHGKRFTPSGRSPGASRIQTARPEPEYGLTSRITTSPKSTAPSRTSEGHSAGGMKYRRDIRSPDPFIEPSAGRFPRQGLSGPSARLNGSLLSLSSYKGEPPSSCGGNSNGRIRDREASCQIKWTGRKLTFAGRVFPSSTCIWALLPPWTVDGCFHFRAWILAAARTLQIYGRTAREAVRQALALIRPGQVWTVETTQMQPVRVEVDRVARIVLSNEVQWMAN